MHAPLPRACPVWCVADHEAEDEAGRRRHRGATETMPGVAFHLMAPHGAHSVELLIELHADDDDPAVGVYIGDGFDGLDLTTETASRLVRRLAEVLAAADTASAQPRVAPNSRPSP